MARSSAVAMPCSSATTAISASRSPPCGSRATTRRPRVNSREPMTPPRADNAAWTAAPSACSLPRWRARTGGCEAGGLGISREERHDESGGPMSETRNLRNPGPGDVDAWRAEFDELELRMDALRQAFLDGVRSFTMTDETVERIHGRFDDLGEQLHSCLLYTSPSPRDR